MALNEVIAQQFGSDRRFSTWRSGDYMDIRIEVHDGILRMLVPRERVTVDAPNIFIFWMVGSSLILLAIAIVFLRNQVRPIERLARTAEAFGKGRAVPDFKPYGASEVRRAAEAFITMRERIDRHVQQRTEMLAGVSHDLKTPLTRMKLLLAMMKEDEDSKTLKRDIVEMEHMLDEYLDFARGEGGEASRPSDLLQVLKLAADAAARAKPHGQERLQLEKSDPVIVSLRPVAIRRCLANLLDNGLKYGKHVTAHLESGDGFAQVVIDDDGPGIPAERREDAFKPFQRLDEGRNLQAGGVGLGLAIARDIARAHGGDVVLDQSPQGGLRAVLKLPL
jgi:two-component system osmolarity sensor histidine kinase EnvZ